MGIRAGPMTDGTSRYWGSARNQVAAASMIFSSPSLTALTTAS